MKNRYFALGLLQVVLIFAFAAPAFAQGGSGDIRLACTGSGSTTITERSTTFANGAGKDDRLYASTSKESQRAIQGAVRFSATLQGPRMRLFAGILPPGSIDDAGQWRSVDDIVLTGSNIKGNVDFGFLAPTFYFDIDRISGEIDLTSGDGKSQFRGMCRKEDAGIAQRF